MIQKLVQLKVKMDSACAVCNEITTNIAKGGSWEPLGHKTLLGKLRVARDAIEAVKVNKQVLESLGNGWQHPRDGAQDVRREDAEEAAGRGGGPRHEAQHARGQEREHEEDALGDLEQRRRVREAEERGSTAASSRKHSLNQKP